MTHAVRVSRYRAQKEPQMRLRTRSGSALMAMALVLALAAAPALAAAGPRLILSPGRGASGTTVTMTIKNCSDPRLWVAPTIDGSAAADFGSPGYIYWETQRGPFSFGYEYAGTWAGSGTTWTASFAASFPPSRIVVFAWCGPGKLVSAIFTVS